MIKTTKAPANKEGQPPNAMISWGWAMALLMPLIGFILGLTQINRDPRGIKIVMLSVLMFFVWFLVLGSIEASSESSY